MSQQNGTTKVTTDTGITGKELEELSIAEAELLEKEERLNHLTSESIEKMKGVSKINRDLQNRVRTLQDLSISLNRKNEDLKRANEELVRQKNENYKMSMELKAKLEKVLAEEREVAIQRNSLAKQLEETTKDLNKAEKFAVIGELAARLAHDLRNPLSVVKNTMDVITAKPNLRIDERLQYIARFRRAVERMSHQIDDVLDFVKKTDLLLQNESIVSIIDAALNDLVIPSNIKITKPQQDTVVYCDPRKLEAVFSNIIVNAIQAMNEKGEVRIRMLDMGTTVKIEFEDTGPGIPPNIINKIFDPLFTTKLTGTGLGLSICKNIVEQHGGSISVKSPPAVFMIVLPKNVSEARR